MKCLLLSTGGTIAMARTATTGASTFAASAGDLVKQLGLNPAFQVDTLGFAQQPSSELDSDFAAQLASCLAERLPHYDACIITHGTDTLEETAFYLHMVCDRSRPIVLTGAMKTANQPGYDGESNLRDALNVAASPLSRGQGTLVVMNKEIHSALHVSKQDSMRYNAFGSQHTGKLGAVVGEQVFYYQRITPTVAFSNQAKGQVALIKLHYDIHTDWLKRAITGVDGLVVEVMGSGRLSAAVAEVLEPLADQIPVVLTPRAGHGHLFDDYEFAGSYHQLRHSNLIMSPLDGLKSALLVRLGLGNGLSMTTLKQRLEGFWQVDANQPEEQ